MSNIESFTIGKGKSTQPYADREEWRKCYLELTVRLPQPFTQQEFLRALAQAEQIIDNFLGKPDVAKIADFDLGKINDLPWRRFVKGSEPGSARPSTPGWIFSNEKGAEKLADALREVGVVELGEWTFKFGGTDNALIQRNRKKESRGK